MQPAMRPAVLPAMRPAVLMRSGCPARRRTKARTRLRRTVPAADVEGPQVITMGDLTIDVPAHRVLVDGDEILLTALEFRLLMDLMTRPGRVQTRDALLERVWGYAPNVETRTVDTHVKRLREKLGDTGSKYIETVRGVGYRAIDS